MEFRPATTGLKCSSELFCAHYRSARATAVMDAGGKLIMECLLETKAAKMVEFLQGLQGTLSLPFEEGPSAAWLHDAQ